MTKTPSTMPFDPGDVVLVRFPFTDLSSAKQRPAVVVSPTAFSTTHGDVVVVAVTGHDPNDPSLALQQWRDAGLLKPTWFKPLIATLSASLVSRRLGALTSADRQRLSQMVRSLLDASIGQWSH